MKTILLISVVISVVVCCCLNGARATFTGNCTEIDEQVTCNDESSCLWCVSEDVCDETDEPCQACSTFDVAQCEDMGGCIFCDSSNQCTEPLNCANCTLASSNDCLSLPGCDWCLSSDICFWEDDMANCEGCSGQSELDCDNYPGCEWCDAGQVCLLQTETCSGCTNLTLTYCEHSDVCAWCESEGICKLDNQTCETCTDRGDENDCSNYNGCEWCNSTVSIDQCELRSVGCPLCIEIDTVGECNNDGCLWCSNTSECIAVGSDCPAYCSQYSSNNNCTEDTDCHWCSDTSNCIAFGTDCLNCTTLDEERCVDFTLCDWCTNAASCYGKGEGCPHCQDFTGTACPCQLCESNGYCIPENATCTNCSSLNGSDCDQSGCLWCRDQCLNDGADCPSCSSYNRNFEQCGNAACQWCESSLQCSDPNDDINCYMCASLGQDVLTCNSYAGCSYCNSTQMCHNSTICETCEVETDQTSCSDLAGCQYCSYTGKCMDIDLSCAECITFSNTATCNIIPGCFWCPTATLEVGECWLEEDEEDCNACPDFTATTCPLSACSLCEENCFTTCNAECNDEWVPNESDMDEFIKCDGGLNCVNCTCELYFESANNGDCIPVCGDGIVVTGEECDDTDGCTTECICDEGWEAVEGVCTTNCGDGIVAGVEQCDGARAVGCDSETCMCIDDYEPNNGFCTPIGMQTTDSNETSNVGDFWYLFVIGVVVIGCIGLGAAFIWRRQKRQWFDDFNPNETHVLGGTQEPFEPDQPFDQI